MAASRKPGSGRAAKDSDRKLKRRAMMKKDATLDMLFRFLKIKYVAGKLLVRVLRGHNEKCSEMG